MHQKTKGGRITILSPKQVLQRLSIALPQTKPGNPPSITLQKS